MHDKPHTFLTAVDKMSVHSLVIYGVAIFVRSLEFTTGVVTAIHLICKPRFLMSGTLIFGNKTNKSSSTHSKLCTC